MEESRHMGGFGNGGSPKWLVDFMENPIKMDDLGVLPFQESSSYRGFLKWDPSRNG